mmetsp:Transcript_37773/g.93779  ORF Transcript_37773/g.93779 Transcript_37773/m.93779 type:complete len:677 (-) Transcript_37773:42-2072(-)
MRWVELCSGGAAYRHKLREHQTAACSCPVLKNGDEWRKSLICPRSASTLASGAAATSDATEHVAQQCKMYSYDNLDCVVQRCDECKDLKLLESVLCAAERGESAGALLVRYEKHQKVVYYCKDGTPRDKKDFVSVYVTFSEWEKEMREFWPVFIAHHNDAKWHDDDFASMRTMLRRGMACVVIDFAQNYSHEPRFENQSKYFSQVQTTIVPVVLGLRVEDLRNITDERRAELIAYFDANNLPHVVTETHFVISSDLQHDNAFILFDDLICPYLKENAPDVTDLHVHSDGCKAQFKCASNFYWVSRQSKEGSGLHVNWSFFESCHDKCYCDPEGGTFKNAARKHELRSRIHMCKNSEDLYKWAVEESGLATPSQSIEAKGGRGIFRRFMYFIPSKGVGSVDRSRLPKLKAEGTSPLHEFVDVGVPGTVSTRRAACHMCDKSWAGERRNCDNIDYTGKPIELTISREHEPVTSLSRVTRSQLNQSGLERAANVTVGSNVCVETHNAEQTVPWFVGKVVVGAHVTETVSPDFNEGQDTIRFEAVRAGDSALRVRLWEALEPGSSTFTLSDIEVLVAARRVRVPDVELVEARQGSRRAEHSTRRFVISPDSLQQIRAEMPTSYDEWEVEKVLQYRTYYRQEQWLIKWKDYGEDRNTWEPLAHLSDDVQVDAQRVKELCIA